MRGSMTISGLDKYMEAIVQAGLDVDKIAQEVLQEQVEPAKELMDYYLKRSSKTWTGATEKTLFSNNAQQDGNTSFIEFGADTGKDPAAWYKEFGTARQAAEPFLRPTLSYYRRRVRHMMKEVCERLGLTV